MFPRHIYYVSAKCGAGKSHGACCYIKRNLFVNNYVYVAPSLHLVSEISERLGKMGVTPRVITSDTHGKGVKKAIVEALKTAPDIGCCLLITWQAYAELPFFPNREFWQLIVDEIPQVDRAYKLKIPFNQAFITEHVEIGYAVNERVARLKPVDAGKLRSFLNKPRDDVHGLFTDFLRDVLFRNRDVFVEIEPWTRMMEKKAVGDSDDENTVLAVSMLSPKLLNGGILLGANISQACFMTGTGAIMG